MPDRRLMTARVTEESIAAWQAFADAHGVTVTALLEALATRLSTAIEADAVEEARAIDAARRSRRRT